MKNNISEERENKKNKPGQGRKPKFPGEKMIRISVYVPESIAMHMGDKKSEWALEAIIQRIRKGEEL